MPFDYDDPYVTISCKILKASQKAVQVEDDSGLTVWVPRSVLHGGDERDIEGDIGSPVQLRLRRWFADKEGLLG